ncbi:hypothetical protein PR202_gb29335 [Eleusine coracana subsp. coracana]|uniref:Uncharacterized protein n=1 Tax=Eleusine coracana subsp. coracana TaxID=191504 RepID=A0AAV5FYT7_ELECO|nr:hypothetical protein PR202_gb29335 [Eleusine coracana subsp. coracana]
MSGSVIYVSFGSVAVMDPNEFLDLARGLADSQCPFLWVVRPSLIRGFESGLILALGDQFENDRFVCDVWRVGTDVEVGTQLERTRIKTAIEKLLDNQEGKELC